MGKAKPVHVLINAHLPDLRLDFCFQAEDQSKDQFQEATRDGSVERTIFDKDKLQETEAIRSTILGYLLQAKKAGDERDLTQDTPPQTSSSLVLGGLVTAKKCYCKKKAWKLFQLRNVFSETVKLGCLPKARQQTVAALKTTKSYSSHTLLCPSLSISHGPYCGRVLPCDKHDRILLKTSIHFPFTSMAVQKTFDFNKFFSGSFMTEKQRN